MKRKSTATKSKTDWKWLAATQRDDAIDLHEVPEIDPRVFKAMEVRMPQPKELVSIRIDPDVLGWFRKQERGYQTRINAVLRSYIEAQSR
jgi:uncharacterized protein (DUF4415 family)